MPFASEGYFSSTQIVPDRISLIVLYIRTGNKITSRPSSETARYLKTVFFVSENIKMDEMDMAARGNVYAHHER
jgi:hypothetical protein